MRNCNGGGIDDSLLFFFLLLILIICRCGTAGIGGVFDDNDCCC